MLVWHQDLHGTFTNGLVLAMSKSLAGRGSDALLVSNVSTSQSDAVNNPVYAVTNPMAVDGAIYEDLHPEGVIVNTTAVTAFTDDGRYSKLQRDISVINQSVASTITGDDSVEAYYGRLGNSQQYAVSAWYMCCDVVSCSLLAARTHWKT